MSSIAPTYGSRGLNIVKGNGVYLYDDQGKKYLDCFSNFGVNILGHNVEDINKVFQNTTECKVYEMTPNQLC